MKGKRYQKSPWTCALLGDSPHGAGRRPRYQQPAKGWEAMPLCWRGGCPGCLGCLSPYRSPPSAARLATGTTQCGEPANFCIASYPRDI